MKQELTEAFDHEMEVARSYYSKNDLDSSFHHLERAHILGQRYLLPHLITHWWMLKVGVQRTDTREIIGQTTRLIAVTLGFLTGWVPKGNTGGANVSAIKPMDIPDDLAPYLKDYSVKRDVLNRLMILVMITVFFIWTTM